jgi:hypothetical protein
LHLTKLFHLRRFLRHSPERLVLRLLFGRRLLLLLLVETLAGSLGVRPPISAPDCRGSSLNDRTQNCRCREPSEKVASCQASVLLFQLVLLCTEDAPSVPIAADECESGHECINFATRPGRNVTWLLDLLSRTSAAACLRLSPGHGDLRDSIHFLFSGHCCLDLR